jgi:hypothetical protein
MARYKYERKKKDGTKIDILLPHHRIYMHVKLNTSSLICSQEIYET